MSLFLLPPARKFSSLRGLAAPAVAEITWESLLHVYTARIFSGSIGLLTKPCQRARTLTPFTLSEL
jgi:hypothetical protein